jgi:predicted TIM-barrel fold metal-dependent hydrolase
MDNRPETIDADVHLVVPSVDTLMPYLSGHWRTYIRETSFKGPVDTSYPRGTSIGGPGVSGESVDTAPSLDDLRGHVFASADTQAAILTCSYAIESIRNPFAASALASAVNDWQKEHWLAQEPRLRGSIVVPVQDPELARAEIDRVAEHPAFVQISLPVHTDGLYGSRRYYPIYDAAVQHNLVIAIQHGGNPGNPPTAVGWPSYFIEEYVGMSHIFQSQVISLVTEGVFDRYPDLRIVLLESGVSWLPSLMWRLDKEWKGLRREVPWVRRLPSEYIKQHIRLTAWPFDAPPSTAKLHQVLDHLGTDDLLLYATDFPHQYDHRLEQALWRDLPESVLSKLRAENAHHFYPRALTHHRASAR